MHPFGDEQSIPHDPIQMFLGIRISHLNGIGKNYHGFKMRPLFADYRKFKLIYVVAYGYSQLLKCVSQMADFIIMRWNPAPKLRSSDRR